MSLLSTAPSFWLVRRSEIESRQIDEPGIPTSVLGEAIGMLRELMSFQIHLRLKHVCFVRLAFCVQTDVMDLGEMLLQCRIVKVILWISAAVPSVADVAPLMLFPTMSVEFVVSVEALSAKATFGMALESGLVDGPGVVVTKPLVFPQVAKGEQFMFMRKDFFVSRTMITHYFAMLGLDMSMKIRPAEAGDITISVGAIVPQQEYCVL